MARLLGDANPELAKKYGLDSWQREQFEKELDDLDQRVKLVSFEEPPEREDGKNDPIAYLPPSFQRYGILDRAHRHRARVGETWFVESVERGGNLFLVPLARFEPDELAGWLPKTLEQVAQYVGSYHPDIVSDHLLKHRDQEAIVAKSRVQELEEQLEQATDTIISLRGEVEALEAQNATLRETRTAPAAASQVPSENPMPKSVPDGAAEVRAPVVTMGDATAYRDYGDVLRSDAFHHPAYLVHFSTDLTRLYLRPDRDGTPCLDGSIEVEGLTRADRDAPPKRYMARWDDQIAGFVVELGAS